MVNPQKGARTNMIEKIRNVALTSQGGAGKTSLAEAMLYKAGVINRMGRVEDGNTQMDFEPEEVKRMSSISSVFYQFPWKKHTINLTDTPGERNFFTDTISTLQAVDGSIMVLDAVDGVKVQTEQAWKAIVTQNLPCMIFINKINRERANLANTLKNIEECLERINLVKLQLPIGEAENFKGIIDLVTMKAYTFDAKGEKTEIPISDDLMSTAKVAREEMIERIVEADDALLEKFLEGEALTDAEIYQCVRKGLAMRKFVPVVCGAATEMIGVALLLDAITDFMPSPLDLPPWLATDPATGELVEKPADPKLPFSALVFKTIADPYAGKLTLFRIMSGTLKGDGVFYNANKDTKERYSQLLKIQGKEQKPVDQAGPGDIVAVAKLKETTTGDTLSEETTKAIFHTIEPMPTLISYAVEAKKQGEEDKIYSSIVRLMEEDIALKVERIPETKEIILSGLGQIHIETTADRIKRKFNVEMVLKTPKVPYRETIKKSVRVQGRHKKQSGGHGQYGDCWIRMEPMHRGEGFVFEDAIVGGVIPKQYIPAIEKGIQEAAQRGVLAGYPCIDFKVTVDDGSYHDVDSSEMAFKVAGSLAFKKGAEEANPILLEPIMEILVTAPDEYMGDIMGDLTSKRGRVLGMDSKGRYQEIKAYVPMAEFLMYAPTLHSMTGGRGLFVMNFSHYDEVPAALSGKLLEQLKAQQASD